MLPKQRFGNVGAIRYELHVVVFTLSPTERSRPVSTTGNIADDPGSAHRASILATPFGAGRGRHEGEYRSFRVDES